ncbi:MAG: hypothetical protein A3K19_25065 [Lentisphaerae bacterium RIFOXYB12_FULL_65_16]|nr:MAG: hypothetical protein A3K18_00840 [Lentisphaerae bacterium RIFOXYA12_64_32]OGV91017.1 MAG: hypothetical protein A3K19_25065 [Lentisphaerae bacterium RIFOXYB12_FULL_65_16]
MTTSRTLIADPLTDSRHCTRDGARGSVAAGTRLRQEFGVEQDASAHSAQALRQQAEDIARARAPRVPENLDTLSPEEARCLLHELRLHQIELELQNEELRRTQEDLAAARAHDVDLYDHTPAAIVTLNGTGRVLTANPSTAALLGVTRDDLVDRPLSRFVAKEDQDVYDWFCGQLSATNATQVCEFRMLRADAVPFWARLEIAAVRGTDDHLTCHAVISDITENREAERRQQLAAEIVTILNEAAAFDDTISRILTAIRRETGFDAVGIRLRNGDDFPYAVQSGFPTDFLLTENTLVARGADGGICRDGTGSIRLACTCGLVLSGQIDPANPRFTSGGSFWTPDSLTLLDRQPAQDPRFHPRNRCIHDGYSSMALIPIRANREIVGLLQLNDRRKDALTLSMVQFFEGVSASIGVALRRRWAADELRESEERYRSLFEESALGILAIDTDTRRFVYGNPSICRMFGYSDAELLQLNLADIHPKDALDFVTSEFDAVLRGEKTMASSLPCRRKDGAVFYADIAVTSSFLMGRKCLVGFFADVTERQRIQETQLFLLQHHRPDSGDDFFKSLARYLTDSLGMDYACIDQLLGDGLTARTLAVYSNGTFEDNVDYTLKNTPCGDVVGKVVCCFPKDVCALFPQDAVLQEMRAVSYVGTTLWSYDGKPIGLIVVIGRQPLANPRLAQTVLKLVAVRAGGELERRQAEEALRRSEEFARRVIESSNDCIKVLDLEGCLLSISEGGKRLLEIDDVTPLLNRSWVDFWKGKEREAAMETVAKARKGETASCLGYCETAKGTPKWWEVVISPIKDAHGNVERLLAVSRDITERRQAEAALQEAYNHMERRVEERTAELEDAYQASRAAEERFRTVADFTHDWETWRGPDGRDIYVSPSCEPITGYRPEEFVNDPSLLERIVHSEDRAAVVQHLRQDSQTQGCVPIDFRIITRGGEERWISHVCQSVYGADGRWLGRRGSNRDITDRKRAEAALRDSEDRLRQVQKMNAIGQLAGGIAHDFNNQLAGILGYADMLAGRLVEPDLKHYADAICTAARRSADLTKQLLAFARKGQYQSIAVDMHAVVAETVAILQHSIDKRITIAQLLRAQPAVVIGDPSQLQNALLNLGVNARDAMPDGGTLTFETQVVHLDAQFCARHPYEIRPGDYLMLAVSDTGCGMSADVKAHLFEPFFTTKPVGKGTGMGLAAVYGTAKNHGGAVNAYSELGHGTTFRIYLPLLVEAAGLPPSVLDRTAGDAAATPPANLRIMVVDDEALVREVLAEMLRAEGHAVIKAADGNEALALYRQHWREVDLLILDMVMPQMNGRDTFHAMKTINPGVRALLSTGFSVDGEAQTILNEGVLGYVGKPYRYRELVAAIAQATKAG